jgi:hypothetical protein
MRTSYPVDISNELSQPVVHPSAPDVYSVVINRFEIVVAAKQLGRFWREADINWRVRSVGSVANDPKRTFRV